MEPSTKVRKTLETETDREVKHQLQPGSPLSDTSNDFTDPSLFTSGPIATNATYSTGPSQQIRAMCLPYLFNSPPAFAQSLPSQIPLPATSTLPATNPKPTNPRPKKNVKIVKKSIKWLMNDFYQSPTAPGDVLTVKDVAAELVEEQKDRKSDGKGQMDSGQRVVSALPRDQAVSIKVGSALGKKPNGKEMTNAFWYKYGLVGSIAGGIKEATKPDGDSTLLQKCIQHIKDHPDEIATDHYDKTIDFLESQLSAGPDVEQLDSDTFHDALE